jgi:glycosyltransferase involved in cell wall biosynthesis
MKSADSAPTVSILLPTYNGAEFLPVQLDSILEQSWSDFELLLVDDGSSDRTPAILRDYASKDRRVRLIPSEGNRGQKARLAELLEASTGAWISIADQDDVWALDKTELLIQSVGSAALAFGRSELIDGSGKRLGRSLLELLGAQRQEGDRLSILLRPQVSGHAMIARREFVSAEMFRSPHPFDWLISIVAQFSSGIVYDDEAVVFHRMHGSNSHNVNVMVRANPLRLRRRHFDDLLTLVERRRVGLMEAANRLAASPLVPEEDRRRFEAVDELCRRAWVAQGGRLAPDPLRAGILNHLRPLAGSERDWRTTVDRLTVLTHGLIHPKTLIRLNRVL